MRHLIFISAFWLLGAGCVEAKPQDILVGTVEVAIEDDFVQEKARHVYEVRDQQGVRHRLKTTREFVPGQKVKLKGKRKGEAFEVEETDTP